MPVSEQDQGRRPDLLFQHGRTLADEDQICVLERRPVDIGSSTSHCFSRIVLERLSRSRYVVTEARPLSSASCSPPTRPRGHIERMRSAPSRQAVSTWNNAMVAPRRSICRRVDPHRRRGGARNERRIGETRAVCAQAGKWWRFFSFVSGGDSLETVMAAYGSGPCELDPRRSRGDECRRRRGTSKMRSAPKRRSTAGSSHTGGRIGRGSWCVDEERAHRAPGGPAAVSRPSSGCCGSGSGRARRKEPAPRGAWRTALLSERGGAPKSAPAPTSTSRCLPIPRQDRRGHVLGRRRRNIFGWEKAGLFGDLGASWAGNSQEGRRLGEYGDPQAEGIRATVIGASQYTTQGIGRTISCRR